MNTETLTKLYEALNAAIAKRDLDAVNTYSQAIQRITFFN